MKLTSPMIAAISIAVLLCLVQVYVDIEWLGAKGDLGKLRAASASEAAQLAALQASVGSFKEAVKGYDAAIGPHGTIQVLAAGLASGDAELSVRSLKVVSNGRPVVSLGSVADAGGVVTVAAHDGTASAEITSGPGRSRISFKQTTGADAALAVHLASYGGEGFYLQKGATDDMTARTDGAGLQIKDSGADFFMAQTGGGGVSIETSNADERAKLSLTSEANSKKAIGLSLGAADASPFLSATGAASGYSVMLVPDRLSLTNKDGSVTLVAAGDGDGGFVVANDKAGDRRAILASGTDGHGSLSVFGSDNRSNTFLPEFDIQKKGTSSQK